MNIVEFQNLTDAGIAFKFNTPGELTTDKRLFDIVHKLKDKKDSYLLSAAAHDQVWFNITMEELFGNATEEELKTIIKLGGFIEDETLSMFV